MLFWRLPSSVSSVSKNKRKGDWIEPKSFHEHLFGRLFEFLRRIVLERVFVFMILENVLVGKDSLERIVQNVKKDIISFLSSNFVFRTNQIQAKSIPLLPQTLIGWSSKGDSQDFEIPSPEPEPEPEPKYAILAEPPLQGEKNLFFKFYKPKLV